MPESAAPHPYPSATITPPLSSPNGTVPPMPSEVTPMHTRTRRPAGAGRWHTVMAPLRKMMRRPPRDAA
jgi:hypothetical protein